MSKVLILCTGNSCRSQMAEGWLRYFSKDTIDIYSAGTHPEPVNRYAVEVMSLQGIDISNYTSNHVNDYIEHDFDFIITVCDNAEERCINLTNGRKKIHESFRDPARAVGSYSEKIKIYSDVSDQLKEYFRNFFKENF